jgi:hypothetical protein
VVVDVVGVLVGGFRVGLVGVPGAVLALCVGTALDAVDAHEYSAGWEVRLRGCGVARRETTKKGDFGGGGTQNNRNPSAIVEVDVVEGGSSGYAGFGEELIRRVARKASWKKSAHFFGIGRSGDRAIGRSI